MNCGVCLGRKSVALRLFPKRRPLYVRCGSCRMRRRARWHVAKRVAGFAFGVVTMLAVGSGYAFKVAWEIRGLVGR